MDIIFKNIEIFIFSMVNTMKTYIIFNIILFLTILIIFILIIIFIYIRNVNNDSKKFINAKKVFRVCNISE